MSQFMSAFLGGVQHPINILQEYLAAFGNKCQAAILSWLDNWTKTKRKEGESDWIWLVLSDLATELGYCKDTIFRHLNQLLNLGVIERQRAKRWATDRAWKYRIVSDQLAEYICISENQTVDISKSVHGHSETSTSIVRNQDNYIDSNSSSTYTQPQTGDVVVVEKDEVEERQEKPTEEEVGEVCIQLRRLSPNITINSSVRNVIRSFWHNVPVALVRVKNAIAQGWCKQPTGLFIQTLKNGVSKEQAEAPVVKEYPRPTLEQLNQLGEMGELVYTMLDEPGYPSVVAVNTGVGVMPWWVVLGVESILLGSG